MIGVEAVGPPSHIAKRVRAWMARAWKRGAPAGRPRAINGEWEAIAPLLRSGKLGQRAAARRLGVGLR